MTDAPDNPAALDERGIDLAIMAYFGAILSGQPDKAEANAETMLTMFGFEIPPTALLAARKARP